MIHHLIRSYHFGDKHCCCRFDFFLLATRICCPQFHIYTYLLLFGCLDIQLIFWLRSFHIKVGIHMAYMNFSSKKRDGRGKKSIKPKHIERMMQEGGRRQTERQTHSEASGFFSLERNEMNKYYYEHTVWRWWLRDVAMDVLSYFACYSFSYFLQSGTVRCALNQTLCQCAVLFCRWFDMWRFFFSIVYIVSNDEYGHRSIQYDRCVHRMIEIIKLFLVQILNSLMLLSICCVPQVQRITLILFEEM